MAQPGPPPASSSATDNPIVAIGRKVKSALTSSDQPSIRIVRGRSTATEKPLPPLPTQEKAQEPPQKASFASRFRSFFDDEKDDGHNAQSKDEYDASTVDLLDVMGMYTFAIHR
jgi:hypothetical protein